MNQASMTKEIRHLAEFLLTFGTHNFFASPRWSLRRFGLSLHVLCSKTQVLRTNSSNRCGGLVVPFGLGFGMTSASYDALSWLSAAAFSCMPSNEVCTLRQGAYELRRCSSLLTSFSSIFVHISNFRLLRLANNAGVPASFILRATNLKLICAFACIAS